MKNPAAFAVGDIVWVVSNTMIKHYYPDNEKVEILKVKDEDYKDFVSYHCKSLATGKTQTICEDDLALKDPTQRYYFDGTPVITGA